MVRLSCGIIGCHRVLTAGEIHLGLRGSTAHDPVGSPCRKLEKAQRLPSAETTQEIGIAIQDMPGLRAALRLAEKMGEGLGEREILLPAVPRSEASLLISRLVEKLLALTKRSDVLPLRGAGLLCPTPSPEQEYARRQRCKARRRRCLARRSAGSVIGEYP